jgi:hypothetical protein
MSLVSKQNLFKENLPDFLFAAVVAFAMVLLFAYAAQGQNVGINNPAPHAKSLLDLTSTDKGLLAPRMTQSQRLGMFPSADGTAKGMLVYQTDNTQGFYYYDGTVWQFFGSSATGWSITGNAGTSSSTNFMGTTDAQDVVFKSNNAEGMRLKTTNKLHLGSTNFTPSFPYSRLNIADENGANSDINMRVAAGGYSQVVFDQSNGTLASPTASSNGQWTGVMVGRAYNGSAYGNNAAIILGIDSTVTGSAIRGNIQFQTSGGAQSEKMRIDRNGNVGIGTTSPYTKLTVYNNDSAYTTAAFRNTNTGGWSGQWFMSSANAIQGHIGYGNASAPRWASQVYAGSVSAVPFVLTTNDTERMRIDVNGNVGIDTTAAQARLHVKSNSAVNWPQILVEERDSVDYSRISFMNKGISKFWTVAAHSENVDSLSFLNFYNSSTFNLLTIKGNGNIGIGNSYPTSKLEVMGSVRIADGSQGAGKVFVSGSTGIGSWQTLTAGSVNAWSITGNAGTNSSTNFIGTTDAQALAVRTNNALTAKFNTDGRFELYNGNGNTLIGQNASNSSFTGTYNTMVGQSSGSIGTAGSYNTFLGYQSGRDNTADNNTFLGYNAGANNTSGTYNTYIGNNAYGTANLSKSAAIGYNANVTASNSLVLGGTGADAVKVGIGVTAPSAELEVNGYTKLGTTAPAIKMIELTGTTSASQGGSVSVAHGLNSAKILSVDVLVEYFSGAFIPASYQGSAGYEFNFYITSSSVYLINQSANSGSILSKPYRVLITYKQ